MCKKVYILNVPTLYRKILLGLYLCFVVSSFHDQCTGTVLLYGLYQDK